MVTICIDDKAEVLPLRDLYAREGKVPRRRSASLNASRRQRGTGVIELYVPSDTVNVACYKPQRIRSSGQRDSSSLIPMGTRSSWINMSSLFLSLRACDAEGMMVAATVVQGTELEQAMEEHFEICEVEYQPIHNASLGCFDCAVLRA